MTIYGLFLLNENSRRLWTEQTFFDFLNGIFPLGICVERCFKLFRLLTIPYSGIFVQAYFLFREYFLRILAFTRIIDTVTETSFAMLRVKMLLTSNVIGTYTISGLFISSWTIKAS